MTWTLCSVVSVTILPELLFPGLLCLPVCRGSNHRRHRHLLGRTGGATEPSEGSCRGIAIAVAVGGVLPLLPVLATVMSGFIGDGGES